MQRSGEMYLETILILIKQKNTVRAVDIAESIGYSKASVSRALSKLKKSACILVDANGYIALTEKGRQIAEKIYERHVVLSNMLVALGVDEETALADACKIEHDISDRSFEAIKKHIEQKCRQK
ncbi:MAG: metal-dependent transcriptional regulator [Clostridiales bacterium]|nr:metal-dependent transcriptional regulator [Clostridiales bacterium]